MGATSTRSRSASCARRSASAVGTMPTVSPLGPTRRTSETRIRSLIRSSVLMCPPDGAVAGRLRRLRAHLGHHDERLPLSQAEASLDTSPSRGSYHRDGAVTSRVGPHLRTGPDDLCCVSSGEGGRCGWETNEPTPLVGSVPSCGHEELIGQHQILAEDSPPGPIRSGASRPASLGRRCRSRGRAPARRLPVDDRRAPAVGHGTQVVALHDQADRAGDVDDQRRGLLLDRRLRARPAP